jgi:hypothetical protein
VGRTHHETIDDLKKIEKGRAIRVNLLGTRHYVFGGDVSIHSYLSYDNS